MRVLLAIIDGGLKQVSRAVEKAWNLEFRTDSGRMNWRAMVAALLGVCFLVVSSGLENIVAILRNGDQPSSVMHPLQLFFSFLIWTLICIAILFAERELFGDNDS